MIDINDFDAIRIGLAEGEEPMIEGEDSDEGVGPLVAVAGLDDDDAILGGDDAELGVGPVADIDFGDSNLDA